MTKANLCPFILYFIFKIHLPLQHAPEDRAGFSGGVLLRNPVNRSLIQFRFGASPRNQVGFHQALSPCQHSQNTAVLLWPMQTWHRFHDCFRMVHWAIFFNCGPVFATLFRTTTQWMQIRPVMTFVQAHYACTCRPCRIAMTHCLLWGCVRTYVNIAIPIQGVRDCTHQLET